MTGAPGDLIVLRAPSANRVYTEAAGALGLAEAHWVLGARGIPASVRTASVGGMDALRVRLAVSDADTSESADGTPGRADAGSLRARAIDLLGSLSVALGVLEQVRVGEQDLLLPHTPQHLERHPSDLETTLKYPGKTNEQFTALLVNLAAALSTRGDRLREGTLDLLDPMCGRGTTLNRALRLGLSPLGIDIDRRDVEAYGAFLTTWLRTHRYKHSVRTSRLTVRGTTLGQRIDAELAADKQVQRAGGGQSVTVYGCDTLRLPDLIGAGKVDVIVADLPYGVQHGSRAGKGLQRSPLQVLTAAAPHWRRVLRDGGALALAVNRHTLDHAEATAALEDAEIAVLSADGAFRHRVDQSIDRDVLLAVPDEHPRLEILRALAQQPVGPRSEQPEIRPATDSPVAEGEDPRTGAPTASAT